MREVDLFFFLAPLEHREVDDPAEFELVVRNQVQVLAQFGAGVSGEFVEDRGVTGREEGGVALAHGQGLHKGVGRLGTEVLGNRTAPAALVLGPEDVAETRLALALGPGVHAVAEGARSAGRRGNGPDGVLRVCPEDLVEQAEAPVAEMVRDVLHLDRVAQVRLVGAEQADALPVRDADEGIGVDRLAVGELLEHAVHDGLDGGEDVFLGDEAHLDVELVELQRPVSAQVLVAETGGDLEIAIEARDHEQLFELLRGLRQGVEFARMQARRHQEVPRAFGRRSRQDRGLVFEKALLNHPLPD